MLSLKYTETSSIVTVNGEKIDLGFIATEPVPGLEVPSFIQVARNTSVIVHQLFTSVRIHQLARPRPPYLTYKEGKQVFDPANIVPQTLTDEPVQFSASQGIGFQV